MMCDVLKTQERQYRSQQVLFQPMSRQNMVKPTRQDIVRPTALEAADDKGALTDTKQRPSNTADLSGNTVRLRHEEVRIR